MLTDVADVYTDNDGNLNDDDVTLADVQSATTSDFHNIGGTDDDVPESGDFGVIDTEAKFEAELFDVIVPAELNYIADADADTKIQVDKGSVDEDKIRFDLAGSEKWVMVGSRLEAVNAQTSVLIGTNSGSVSTGADNSAVGYNALKTNTIGYSNAAFGRGAMFSNTEGYMNTATGFQALFLNTTGITNTATGAQALHGNTLGSGNTANGFQALFNNAEGLRNTATGYQALYTNTTNGNSNTAFGHGALLYNETGDFNVAVGASSLSTNTIGDFNTAIGTEALALNDIGTHNTAVGTGALGHNSEGKYNVGIGHNSNYLNEEGNGNTSIGYESGAGIVSNQKERNVFVGYQAGYNTGVGSDANIFLGYKAGFSETGNNKLYIENTDSADPLIYGDFSSNLLKINGSLELANGTSAASLKFFEPSGSGANFTKFQSQAQAGDVTYTLPAADGTANQILQTNGSGVLSWVDDGVKNPVTITSGTIDGTVIGGTTPAAASVSTLKVGTGTTANNVLIEDGSGNVSATKGVLSTETSSLKVLRGTIHGAGGITSGNGFSVTHPSAGNYTINFTSAFGVAPSPVVSLVGTAKADWTISVNAIGTGSFKVEIYDATGAAANNDFTFIVMGM